MTNVIVKVYDGKGQQYDVPDGLSAYELAVNNGFEGSEAEWLESLNGKDGTDGKDGKTPVKGEDYFTEADKLEMIQEMKKAIPTEEWTFTLDDDSTVTKKVVVME